jgi:hypothetical protein
MSSTDIEIPSPDTISGFGLINIPKALMLIPPNSGVHLYVKKDSIADSLGQPPYADGLFNLYLALANNGSDTAFSFYGRLSPSDSKSSVLQDSVFFGNLPPEETVLNVGQPFRIRLAPGLISGERFRLMLNLHGDIGFTQTINLDFPVGQRLTKRLFHHRNGNVEFTLSNFGAYGFESGSLEMRSLPGFDEGLGFRRKTEAEVSRVFESSFIAGLNDSMVSNTASNEFCCFPDVLQSTDADFAVHAGGNLTYLEPGPSGGVESFSIFDDRLARYPFGLVVSQKSYSFDSVGADNFVLLQYTLKNENSSTWNGLRAGLFFDFNFFDAFGNYLADKAGFERSLGLGYAYHESAPAYRGIAAADTGGLSTFNAIRISPEVVDGFTLVEKWLLLSSGFTDTAIVSATDAAILAAKGPFTLSPGDSIKIAFALVAATTLDSLKSYTQTAQNIYRRIASIKGDLNADGSFSPADVVLELNCVFLSNGSCPLERADLDCNGLLQIPDIVHVLNRVFLGNPAPCL